MIEKLVYKKIGKDTLAIDIHNGFSIVAMESFDKEQALYYVNFYLKDNDDLDLYFIDKQANVEFKADKSTIYPAILKHVSTLLSASFYDYYIERYKYFMQCFEIGEEVLKNERLNNAG